MIDLHTHTIFSDGELIPFELVRRAEVIGYKYIALTDHLDFSTMDFVIPKLVKAARKLNELGRIKVFAGCELTHIPPSMMTEAVCEARRLGAQIVVAHGESTVEPVALGTNKAALLAGVDILAHPGLILEDDVKLAAEKKIFLEITARGGHNIANGHVVKLAKKHGAPLVVNTDAHAPKDLISYEFAKIIATGAGLEHYEVSKIYEMVEVWLKQKI